MKTNDLSLRHRISTRLSFRTGVSFALLLTAAMSSLVPAANAGGVVTVPADLSPGDSYHLLFLSTPGTQVHDALSTDIEVYNTFITGVANSSPALMALGTTWKAVGCTPTVSARTNTGIDPSVTGVPIYRTDGTRVANTYPALWGGLLAAPNITELGAVGNPVPVSWAHTGCRSDGTPFPARELGGPIVAVRTGTFSFASAWLNATGRSRFEGASFYGISGVLTVPGPTGTDLTVTKTDSVDPVLAGNSLTYTITVENNGPSDAENVVATETLPAGVTLVATSGCTEDDSGVPTCTLGTIANGASKQYTVEVTVDSSTSGMITNNVSVTSDTTDTSPGDESASEETTVNTAADLVITKIDSADPITAGENLTYTITVANNGPSDAANVVVTETLPAGVTLVATSGCTEDDNGVPTCTLGAIADGASKQYTVEVTVDSDTAAGMLTNSVSVTSDTTEGNAGDESASEETTVEVVAALTITKDDSHDPVTATDSLSYTITVTNAGPSDAINVEVTETLPPEVTFVATDGCDNDANGVPVCELGTIASGSSKQYTVDVTIDSMLSQMITNSVSVTTDTPEAVTDDNSTSEETWVDNVLPVVENLDSVPSTQDNEITECETINSRLFELSVTFNEDLATPTDPANYQLVSPGADGTLDTSVCGPLANDDQAITFQSIIWDANAHLVQLYAPLPNDLYRLLVCPSLTDLAGNPLDGDGDGTGGDALQRNFRYDFNNLFANAHFDCDLGSWDPIDTGGGQIDRALLDADGSADSGSSHFDDTTGQGLQMEQCVAIGGAGEYKLQGRVRIDAMADETSRLTYHCGFYSTADCSGAEMGSFLSDGVDLDDTAGSWQDFEATAVVPSGTVSARCGFGTATLDGAPDAYFDQLFIQGTIFSDGFESGDTSGWLSSP